MPRTHTDRLLKEALYVGGVRLEVYSIQSESHALFEQNALAIDTDYSSRSGPIAPVSVKVNGRPALFARGFSYDLLIVAEPSATAGELSRIVRDIVVF